MVPRSSYPGKCTEGKAVGRPAGVGDKVRSSPVNNVFSRVFSQVRPVRPRGAVPTSRTSAVQTRRRDQELGQRITRLQDRGSALSSQGRRLRSAGQQLLSTGRALEGRLSRIGRATELLGRAEGERHTYVRERGHYSHVLHHRSILRTSRSEIQSRHRHLGGRQGQVHRSVTRRIRQRSRQVHQYLGRDNSERHRHSGHVLFTLYLNIYSSVLPVLTIIVRNH